MIGSPSVETCIASGLEIFLDVPADKEPCSHCCSLWAKRGRSTAGHTYQESHSLTCKAYMDRPVSESALDFSALQLNEGRSKQRSSLKSSATSQFQAKRRKEALEKQQQARSDRTEQARRLAFQQLEKQGERQSYRNDAEEETAVNAQDYSKQLMQPEWMLAIPEDLSTQWYVMPRPEGKRCLVIASQGSTVSRLRNGRILHRFSSWLPNGSRATQLSSESYCILDCIFHEANATYYLMDVMCWKGYSLYDCNAEFRLYWRETKLRETDSSRWEEPADCRYSITPVPAYECTPAGLQTAHSGEVPFQRDGCYFLHREGDYDTEGLTPLALLWKDPQCSQYFTDTDADGSVPKFQQIILRYTEDGCLSTADDPPVSLGKLLPEHLPAVASNIRPGKLLRFSIREGGLKLHEGEVAGADLHFEGMGNQRRGRADTLSKIVFQHMARTQPILLSHFSH